MLAAPALNNGTQLLAPTVDGAPGQVIGTDGKGNLSFIDGGSGSGSVWRSGAGAPSNGTGSDGDYLPQHDNVGCVSADGGDVFGRL